MRWSEQGSQTVEAGTCTVGLNHNQRVRCREVDWVTCKSEWRRRLIGLTILIDAATVDLQIERQIPCICN